jgi:UDP-N-acetylmuramate dehydrogenase
MIKATAVMEARGQLGLKEIKNLVKGKVEFDKPLAPLTTYRLGGKASVYVEPDTAGDLAALLKWLMLKKVPTLVLGGGSNVLFADEGYRGVVVRLGKKFEGFLIEKDRVRAKAATKLASVVKGCCEAGLGGIEFLAGIPGTIGGAVVGNAGAKKAWIGSFVEELTVVTQGGAVKTLKKIGFKHSYRRSSLKDSGMVLTEVVLKLKKEPKGVIGEKIREYLKTRKRKQPREGGNAGSVFKNPPGEFAGRLIESLGLKGKKVGGARVSEVHANFIINDGRATSRDVVSLMRDIQERVKAEYGIRLEPEVLPMGDWDWDEVKDVFGDKKSG